MHHLLLSVIFPLVLCQQPYGISQLDNYARLLNNENLGGLGHYQAALASGQIRGWEDLEGKPRLSGLPPLPMTHEEVVHQLTSSTPTQTPRVTARPTKATTVATIIAGPYNINPVPELPPTPEEKQKGFFDDDGNFVPLKEDKHSSTKKIQGTKIHELSDKKRENVEDYETENFYDDPVLHPANNKQRTRKQKRVQQTPQQQPPLPRSNKPRNQQTVLQQGSLQQNTQSRIQARQPNSGRQQRVIQLIEQHRQPELVHPQGRRQTLEPPPQIINQTSTISKSPSSSTTLAQLNSSALSPPIPASVSKMRPITRFQVPQPHVQPTPSPYPAFVYRPKPKANGREEFFTNVLQEIEEYDDFVEQQRVYRESFPAAKVYNPYQQLHPGQLLPPVFQRGVVVDSSGTVKPLEGTEFNGGPDARQNPVEPATFNTNQNQFTPAPIQPVQPVNPPTFPQQQTGVDGLPGLNLLPANFLSSATEHPLMNLFNIFQPAQPRVHAAPNVAIDGNGKGKDPVELSDISTATVASSPHATSAQSFQLVNIQQKPVDPVMAAVQLLFPNTG